MNIPEQEPQVGHAERSTSVSPASSTSLDADAEIAVIHWRHEPHDAHLSGFDVNAEAVRALTSEPGWRPLVRHDDQDFVLDVLRRGAS